jgi:hypothetical protein
LFPGRAWAARNRRFFADIAIGDFGHFCSIGLFVQEERNGRQIDRRVFVTSSQASAMF